MPALNRPYETFERPGLVVAYRVASVKIHKGALVGVNPAGYLVPMTPQTPGLRFVGVANETVDNAAGSPGERSVNVTKSGSFVFAPAAGYSPAQGDLGTEVFAASDWEVQTSPVGLANPYKVGTVVALERTANGQTGVRIRIERHVV